MIRENLQKYAYVILFINLAFILVNLAGFSPVTIEIAGFDIMADMTGTLTQITTQFQEASNGLEYMIVAGFLIIMGVKIVIEFLLLVFVGLVPVMAALGVPSVIYLPIIAVIDAIIMYDFGKMLLRLG